MAARRDSDATIFIDANIFLHTILGPGKESASCARFLEEAEAETFPIATSVIVMNEVLHRLLIASVVSNRGIGADSAVHYMKLHPEAVRDAGSVWEVMDDIRSIRSMKICGISPATFDRSLPLM